MAFLSWEQPKRLQQLLLDGGFTPGRSNPHLSTYHVGYLVTPLADTRSKSCAGALVLFGVAHCLLPRQRNLTPRKQYRHRFGRQASNHEQAVLGKHPCFDGGRRQLMATSLLSASAFNQASVIAEDLAAKDWRRFPNGFIWGAATAAFQIEGGAFEAGKGPSIWDTFSHVEGNIFQGANADVACDHLHRYKEDVALMRQIGLKSYRLSISWPRVLPEGTLGGGVNEAGLRFYESLFLELQANGIEPVVTLYHWDLPQALEENGGWLDKSTVDHFADYAKLCFTRFGHVVRTWCTINEPWTQCVVGYCYGSHAPGRSVCPGTEPYLAGHHMLLAHAAAVKIFRTMRPARSRIAMVLNSEWFEPQDPGTSSDVKACERALAWNLLWFADPLYTGDYPAIMRERCGDRLPSFSQQQQEDLKGSNDFFAVNCYSARYVCEDSVWRNFLNTPATLKILPFVWDVAITKLKTGISAALQQGSTKAAARQEVQEGQSVLVSAPIPRGGPASPIGVPKTSWAKDPDYLSAVPLDSELTAMGWPVAHYGLGRLLGYIQKAYEPPGGIVVTEAGAAFMEESGFSSEARQKEYLESQAMVVKRAIAEGADVRGYFWWSFYDNFEWSSGYSKRFGLFSVDFATNGSLERKARQSAFAFRELSKNNALSYKVSYRDFAACLRRPDNL